MRIDHVRILEVVKAYEKTRVGNSRKQGGEDVRLPPIRDEVIISTEARRQQIRDRVLGQVVERLRTLPSLDNSSLDVDVIVEEAIRDHGSTSLDSEEKAQIRERSLNDLRRERTSR